MEETIVIIGRSRTSFHGSPWIILFEVITLPDRNAPPNTDNYRVRVYFFWRNYLYTVGSLQNSISWKLDLLSTQHKHASSDGSEGKSATSVSSSGWRRVDIHWNANNSRTDTVSEPVAKKRKLGPTSAFGSQPAQESSFADVLERLKEEAKDGIGTSLPRLIDLDILLESQTLRGVLIAGRGLYWSHWMKRKILSVGLCYHVP